MASIQKMSNGWRYRVSYKDGDKYKTKTQGGFRTKRECELSAAELEKKLHAGHDITAGDQLFPEYMRNWFEVYKKGKHSPANDVVVELAVKLVEQYFVGVKLKELTRDMYQRFLNDFAETHATGTVKNRHIYIKACIKNAIEDGVITKDPTYKAIVKGKKEETAEELKFLNFEEVKALVEEIKKELHSKFIAGYIILFAIATGARIGEIIGLTWDCVEFEKRTITINKTWDYKYTDSFSSTKTYASMRTITIDKETCNLLKTLKNIQNKNAILTGVRNTNNLCFVNSFMEVLPPRSVRKVLKKMCKKSGITEITLHGLRHSHASMLLYQGINVKYVSKRLGHKDIVTTLQTYSHILDEMEQKESRQVDETMERLFDAK